MSLLLIQWLQSESNSPPTALSERNTVLPTYTFATTVFCACVLWSKARLHLPSDFFVQYGAGFSHSWFFISLCLGFLKRNYLSFFAFSELVTPAYSLQKSSGNLCAVFSWCPNNRQSLFRQHTWRPRKVCKPSFALMDKRSPTVALSFTFSVLKFMLIFFKIPHELSQLRLCCLINHPIM